MYRHTGTQTHRYPLRHIDRHVHTCPQTHLDRQTDSHIEIQTHKEKDSQRYTQRRAPRHTGTQTLTSCLWRRFPDALATGSTRADPGEPSFCCSLAGSMFNLFKEYKEPSFLERKNLPSLTSGFSERRMGNSSCWRKTRAVGSQGTVRLFPQESVALHSL